MKDICQGNSRTVIFHFSIGGNIVKDYTIIEKVRPTIILNNKIYKMVVTDLRRNYSIYIMSIPVLLFYAIFCYKPMVGIIIAFKEYNPSEGIMGSPWVGLSNFYDFFRSIYFYRIFRNTINISITSIIVGFPAPIILALLINELKSKTFARTVQTITYLPHFISLVVICGLINSFLSSGGLINNFFSLLSGGDKVENLLNKKEMFIPIYVMSGIWQEVGWGSIIYLAALAGINQELYDAANIDGAGRWRQTINITLPCIMPTIIVLFILRLGSFLNVGFEKIILLYNPLTYDVADVIPSFVYRAGLKDFRYSFSTAVGLFNSMINFFLVYISNYMCRKFNNTSLW